MGKIITIDFDNSTSAELAITSLKSVLLEGGVIGFPTDTFYGIGADPRCPEGIARIFELKGRPADKPLLVLIGNRAQLNRLTTEVSPVALKMMEAFWPGPLTLLFPVRPNLPDSLTAGTGKIGVRLPGSSFTRNLLSALDMPLTAPSANLSGQQEHSTAHGSLGNDLDVVLDGGPTAGGKPSTLLDTTVSPPVLIREGAVSRSDIEARLGFSCITR